MDQERKWIGKSGKSYTYYVYEIGTDLEASAGNYIFAKDNGDTWKPIYIGETEDLSQRFDDHHAMPCIRRKGATHLHAHLSGGSPADRRAEESDLIQKFGPTCNKQ